MCMMCVCTHVQMYIVYMYVHVYLHMSTCEYTMYKPSKCIYICCSGIKIVPRGMSRGVRKIAQSKVPNLSKYEDISEYVLG